MAIKIKISLFMEVSWIKPSALADNFMSVPIIGMTNGKLKIAIKVALLSAFEAIAETKVKVMEKPTLPKKRIDQNNGNLLTGFSKMTVIAPYVSIVIKNNKAIL